MQVAVAEPRGGLLRAATRGVTAGLGDDLVPRGCSNFYCSPIEKDSIEEKNKNQR